MLAASLQAQSTLTLSFANNTNSEIAFYGSSQMFNFVTSPTNGLQWTVTGESGGHSAIGLQGSFLNGPYNYGPITSSGLIETAAVTGPLGNMVINDGSGYLSGSVDWIDVTTVFNSIGVLNGQLDVNVTNITYSGSNPDLQSIFNNQPAVLDLTFQFVPGQDLRSLSAGTGPYATSYSGSIAIITVPEPSTISLGMSGVLAGLFLLKHRRLGNDKFLKRLSVPAKAPARMQ